MDDINKIIQEEAYRLMVRESDILGRRRSRLIAEARHRAMCRARLETDATFEAIAAVFNRNHSTVMYAVKKYRQDYEDGLRNGPFSQHARQNIDPNRVNIPTARQVVRAR